MDYDYEDNLKRNRTGVDRRPWQGEDDDEAYAAVVLRCVFGYLSAKQLWRCGAVCRAWRRASLDDALWRRLLLPDGTPQVLRSLRRTETLTGRENLFPFRWREEYYRTVVGWRRARLEVTGSHSAPLLCVSLHSSSLYLALLDEDARLTVWENTNEYKNDSRWTVRRSGTVSPSWSLATQAQWAPHARRLLLTGRLALTDRSELLVLEFNEQWIERTVCRIACGSSGGCWVDDESFLALQLRLLAPGIACTTVWLTAASQEIQSEHAGVTTPLMRIYNEASTQITHASVTPISTDGCTSLESELDAGIDRITRPTASYYRALRPSRDDSESSSRWLVGACGLAGGDRGARGEARAVSAWSLPRALCLPRVSVREALSERVRRHRQRASRPLEPEQPPDEDSVRMLCTPPSAVCDLSAQIFGMTFHPRGGCVWVTTAAGATCLSLPALRPLLQVPREVTLDEPSLPPHYVMPSTDDEYFVSPVGRGSPLVSVWSVMSAGRGPLLAHESPALAALLLPTFNDVRALLVLTTEALFIWQTVIA